MRVRIVGSGQQPCGIDAILLHDRNDDLHRRMRIAVIDAHPQRQLADAKTIRRKAGYPSVLSRHEAPEAGRHGKAVKRWHCENGELGGDLSHTNVQGSANMSASSMR